MSRKQPLILISSSGDLHEARAKIDKRLRLALRDLSLSIKPYLWEDETESGQTIEPGAPIQQQIDDMLGNRVELTLVMFGERLGEPLAGKPVEGTAELLEAWKDLQHPWPEEPAARWKALDEGKFPLTGTVYELLVALALNRKGIVDGATAPDRLRLHIGYVADRTITAATTREEITFNQRRLFKSADTPPPGSKAYDLWKENNYEQQMQGIINLVKALARSPHGAFPLRFETEGAMVEVLTRLAVASLKKAYPTEASQPPFKSDLSPFRVDDPMPFPDRKSLRELLKERLLADGATGQILALRGSSGCGKSSLLQKGLLGAEPPVVRGAVPVALRPSDISARSETTPLLRFLGALADRLEEVVGVVPKFRSPPGGKISDRIDYAIDALTKSLERNKATLVLGVDQFEEVLDLAAMDNEKRRGQPNSWWQILHFIGRAARRDRILVAVTLESQRYRRLDEMAVEDRTGIRMSFVNVNFEASMVSEFVRDVAARRGLPIAPKLAEEIEQMVERYDKSRRNMAGGAPTSSFLPLLSLWLHRLFVKFRDRKQPEGSGATDAFGRTDLIGPDDLKQRGIDMELGPLIAELVEDAWGEAGQLGKTKLTVVNEGRLRAFINEVSRWGPGGHALVVQCANRKPFHLEHFVRVLLESGIKEIPGVALPAMQVRDKVVVENFFGGLVGVDDEGNMRLTDMPRETNFPSMSRLVESLTARRLLERVVATDSVRLIHQAVVDNWAPAREWYQAEKATFIVARTMRQAAHEAGDSPDFSALAMDVERVRGAAALLGAKRAVWSGPLLAKISESDRSVRAFCIGLLSAASDSKLEYDPALKRAIAVEVARYDLPEALARWLDEDPELLHVENSHGQTLLARAAWDAPRSISILLARGAMAQGGSEPWHPITGAIHTGNIDALRTLLAHYDGPEAVVGPRGLTMLHEAAYSRSRESMLILLERASNPDVRNDDKLTPLHRAAGEGRVEIAEMLLQAGADPLAVTENGRNVLHFATTSNSPGIVQLVRSCVTDDDRESLLFGRKEDGHEWEPPIEQAAYVGVPEVLAALLDWAGQDPIHRNLKRAHPLLCALERGAAPVSQPVADRISSCVDVLLRHGDIPPPIVEHALSRTRHLPDARRLIENHMVLHSDSLDAVHPERVLGWITTGRPEIAAEALRKRPTILDYVDEDGLTGARTILGKAAPETLLICLVDGLGPKADAEVFRLEAALRVCRAALAEGQLRTDQGPGASVLGLAFPGVDAARLHPVIPRVIEAPDAEWSKRLLSMATGGSPRTLLHRLAIRGDLELYTDVMDGLTDPPPLDTYGRHPSALAPPAMQHEFAALEAGKSTSGVH